MHLYELLQLKYPNADFTKDILLQDDSDGKGPYIKEWNLSGTKPTKSVLDQWEIDMAPAYQFKLNMIANAPIYAALDAIDLKSIRALRTNDNDRLHELEEQAIALRMELLPTH